MKRIAAPMIGGMVTATILTLLVIPGIFMIWKGRGFKVGQVKYGRTPKKRFLPK